MVNTSENHYSDNSISNIWNKLKHWFGFGSSSKPVVPDAIDNNQDLNDLVTNKTDTNDMVWCPEQLTWQQFYEKHPSIIQEYLKKMEGRSNSLLKKELKSSKREEAIYKIVWDNLDKVHEMLGQEPGQITEEEYVDSVYILCSTMAYSIEQGIMIDLPLQYNEGISILDYIIHIIHVFCDRRYNPDDPSESINLVVSLVAQLNIVHLIRMGTTLNKDILDMYKDGDLLSLIISNVAMLNEDVLLEFSQIARDSIISGKTQINIDDLACNHSYFYIKYQPDSVVVPAKVMNYYQSFSHIEKDSKFGIRSLSDALKCGTIMTIGKLCDNKLIAIAVESLKHGLFHVGNSIVRIERTKERKRNYVDVSKGCIKLSFNTKVGKINIYLSSSKVDCDKIEVRLKATDRKKLDELPNKEDLGKNCFLGGKSVFQAIQDKEFIKQTVEEKSEVFSSFSDYPGSLPSEVPSLWGVTEDDLAEERTIEFKRERNRILYGFTTGSDHPYKTL